MLPYLRGSVSLHGLLLAALATAACAEEPAEEQRLGQSTIDTPTGDGDGGALDGAIQPPFSPDVEPDSSWDAGDGSLGDAATSEVAAADAAAGSGAGSGTLPSVTDLTQPGLFEPIRAAGPGGYVVFHPEALGEGGIKHPIVSWGPGAAENAGMFTTLLHHLASHGFVAISYDATPEGAELTNAIDWLIAENERTGSPFHQKLDTSRIAAGGHSAGSLATFRIAGDARLTTTLHISGGTFAPHTDIQNLHAPALFICGEPPVDGLLVGDVARPNCDIDFENAAVPVFYGITKGASHMTPTEIGDPALRSYQLAAIAGWLRWQLAGDTKSKAMFVGPSCSLCSDAKWMVEQKGLN